MIVEEVQMLLLFAQYRRHVSLTHYTAAALHATLVQVQLISPVLQLRKVASKQLCSSGWPSCGPSSLVIDRVVDTTCWGC